MPTSSELAQYRLLMQLQNQQNRIKFPELTPNSNGAGVNFLQGLSGGLGYGIQRRQQGNSIEELNQMMQAQAVAEQAAAVEQYNLQRQGFTELGYNPALANFPKETQNAYIAQTGQPIVSGLNIKNLEPLLQNLSPDLANQIRIEVLAGKNPGALNSIQQVSQAAGTGAAASEQKYQDTLQNLRALSEYLPKDKQGNFMPEGVRTLQNAIGTAFGAGTPTTAADLQKETYGVKAAEYDNINKKLTNMSVDLGNTTTGIKNATLQDMKAREDQFNNVILPSIRNNPALTEPQKIQQIAAQRTQLGLPEGAPLASFFSTTAPGKGSAYGDYGAVSTEARDQAVEANKPKPIQMAPSRAQIDIGNIFKSLEAGSNFMTPQQYDQAKGKGPLQGLNNYFFQPAIPQQQPRLQQPSFILPGG